MFITLSVIICVWCCPTWLTWPTLNSFLFFNSFDLMRISIHHKPIDNGAIGQCGLKLREKKCQFDIEVEFYNAKKKKEEERYRDKLFDNRSYLTLFLLDQLGFCGARNRSLIGPVRKSFVKKVGVARKRNHNIPLPYFLLILLVRYESSPTYETQNRFKITSNKIHEIPSGERST